MASKPGVFGRKKNAFEAAPSTTATPTPISTIPPLHKDTDADHLRKRQKTLGVKGAPSKKSTALSFVANDLGQMADMYVSEKELKAWRAKSEDEKGDFIVKAGWEMVLHNMDREANKAEQGIHLKNVEKEARKLKGEVTEQEKHITKLQDDLKAEMTRYDKLVQDKDASLDELKEANSKLAAELQTLKAGTESVVDLEAIKDASFDEGMNSYIALFLAGEPSYNWAPTFGRGVANYIADFATKEAGLIAQKKADIEADLAREAAEDAATKGQEATEGAS